MREPVLIVAQDLIGAARVQNWQLVHTVKDFLQLAHDDLAPTLALKAIKAFLKCSLNGPG
jgi:hypothetical protein